MKVVCVLLLTVLLLASPARAEESSGATMGSGPVSVTADALEYHDQKQVYVARGHAEVTRGTVTITANLITAYATKMPDGQTDISRAVATGNVVITSGNSKVTGERGVYDAARQVAVLKGGDLRLTTPQDTVTARDSLEYWEGRNLAVARGQAVAVRGDRRVEADTLTALLAENAQKQLDISRLGADGNVRLTTPTDIARSERGTYDVTTQKALLEGNVRLTRGDNQLNGARAEINLATGVSRLLSGNGGPRVRGLLVPKDAPEVP